MGTLRARRPERGKGAAAVKVLLFQPRFAELVAAGTKRQTIRLVRRSTIRPIRVGDELSLRRWSGAPYRSKQIVLRHEICRHVEEIKLWRNNFRMGKNYAEDVDNFAADDGFADYAEMMDWFERTHGLPFTGVLIGW